MATSHVGAVRAPVNPTEQDRHVIRLATMLGLAAVDAVIDPRAFTPPIRPHRPPMVIGQFAVALPTDDEQRGLVVASCPSRAEAEFVLTLNPGCLIIEHTAAIGSFILLDEGCTVSKPRWPARL